MIEFESKRKFNKRLYSKLTLFLLAIVLVFMANNTYKIMKKHRIVSDDLGSSVAILEGQQQRRDQLQRDIDRIDGKVGKEEILRKNYSLAKEGEEAIYILDSGNEESGIIEEKGILEKISSFFGSLFN